MKRYAIIDLGSNSVRMNIVQVGRDGSYNLLDQAKEMVRLSENMGSEKKLKPEPIRRTIETLKLFKKLAVAYDAEKIYPLATAAVRMATNQEEFLQTVKTETGFSFQVLSGEDEAYYDYLGVINTIEIDKALIVDIGGGSTELIWVEDRKHKEAVSLPIGSVTLTEMYLKDLSKKNIKHAIEVVESLLDEIPWLKKLKGYPIVGLGGVMRALAKVDRNQKNLQILSLHNYRISCSFCQGIFEKILDTPPESLSKISGINKNRADIMAGGILPIYRLMKKLSPSELIISGNGLREGWFYKTYTHSKEMAPVFVDVLDHSLENLSRHYKINMIHCLQVRRLSLKIFDCLQPAHHWDKTYRKLLYVASLLHDIGMYVEYYNHQNHGFYLAMNSRIYGLTNAQIIACSYLIGTHRKEKLKVDMSRFEQVISKKELKKLSDLALLIGLSEKLDRSESGAIEDLEVEIKKDCINIILHAEEKPTLEMAAAEGFVQRLSECLGKTIFMIHHKKDTVKSEERPSA